MPQNDYYLPQRRLVAQNENAMIQAQRIPRSRFINQWTRKTAFNAAYLVPFLCDEIYPGDHMTYECTIYARQATLVFPNFSQQRFDTFFFYVPCRILWDNWKKFMGEQANPIDTIAYTIPKMVGTVGGDAVGSLVDHFGVPVLGQITGGISILVNALPFRAYNRIWNDWFRDQNIINSATVKTDDTNDAAGIYPLQKRAKGHDFFTTCLPWPQKFTSPVAPLSGLAPVIGIGGLPSGAVATTGPVNVVETGASVNASYGFYWPTATANLMVVQAQTNAAPTLTTNTPQIYANLALAAGMNINTFRQSFMLQQLLERDARGGTRYVEAIKSQFGVISPDFRLQRPEYIGGGSTPIGVTPVAQTSPTTAPAGVLGLLGATGTAAGQHRATYAATEHGFIIGLANIKSEVSYQQGLHKMWSRNTRYDFYTPDLAQLGEQAILQKQIYATGTTGVANDDKVFGYQEAWHELRTHYNEVTGIMRSTAASTIDPWHMAQKFTSAPVLDQTFIQDQGDNILDRVLAAGSAARTGNQQYLVDILINRNAVRPLPVYGTPAMLGRF